MNRTRFGDSIIIIVSVILIVFSFSSLRPLGGEPQVHVRTDRGLFIYDLSVDTVADFSGPVGSTTIEISEGKVHVHDSDCRNKVCVSAGWVSRIGDWIICLPNNVFILIEGSLQEGLGDVDDTAF